MLSEEHYIDVSIRLGVGQGEKRKVALSSAFDVESGKNTNNEGWFFLNVFGEHLIGNLECRGIKFENLFCVDCHDLTLNNFLTTLLEQDVLVNNKICCEIQFLNRTVFVQFSISYEDNESRDESDVYKYYFNFSNAVFQ